MTDRNPESSNEGRALDEAALEAVCGGAMASDGLSAIDTTAESTQSGNTNEYKYVSIRRF